MRSFISWYRVYSIISFVFSHFRIDSSSISHNDNKIELNGPYARANKLFSEIDVDENGLIDYEETIAYIVVKEKENLNNRTIKWSNIRTNHYIEGYNYELKKHYNEMDANGDGYIQREEMIQDRPRNMTLVSDVL